MLATYRTWAATQPALPLFYQPWWLDAVCGTSPWHVALAQDGSGHIQGVLPYWLTRRYGLPILTHPPLTPRLGPWLVYPPDMARHKRLDFTDRTLHTLQQQLPAVVHQRIKCHPLLTNWYPFHKLGYRQTTAYTYYLDLAHSGTHWASLEDSTRNKIRQGRNQLRIESTTQPATLLPVLRQSLPPADGLRLQQGLLARIHTALAAHDAVQLSVALDTHDQVVGASLIAYDATYAYNLLLGGTPAGRQAGAAPFLLWHAILQASRRVSYFDFEGSMIPGVERFFRGFRPALTPYHVLTKSRLPNFIQA